MITLEYLKTQGKYYSKCSRIKMLSDIQRSIEVIDEIYPACIDRKKSIASEIQSRCNEISGQVNLTEEQFQDEVNFLFENDPSDEILELVEDMQIVALYKSVEITMQKILKVSELPLYNNNKLNFFKLISHPDLNVDIYKIYGYSAFNELRLINNCIKHSGRVSRDLSKYGDWIFDSKITQSSLAYERLKQDVQRFVLEWGDELVKIV